MRQIVFCVCFVVLPCLSFGHISPCHLCQPQIPERMDSLSTLSDSAVCGMYSRHSSVIKFFELCLAVCSLLHVTVLLLWMSLQLPCQEDMYLTLLPALEPEADLRYQRASSQLRTKSVCPTEFLIIAAVVCSYFSADNLCSS